MPRRGVLGRLERAFCAQVARDPFGALFDPAFVRSRAERLRRAFLQPFVREQEGVARWQETHSTQRLSALAAPATEALRTSAGELQLPVEAGKQRALQLTQANEDDFPVEAPFLPPRLQPEQACVGHCLARGKREVVANGLQLLRELREGVRADELQPGQLLLTAVPPDASLARLKLAIKDAGGHLTRVVRGVGDALAQLVVQGPPGDEGFAARLETATGLRAQSQPDAAALRTLSLDLRQSDYSAAEMLSALGEHSTLLDFKLCEKFCAAARVDLSTARRLCAEDAAAIRAFDRVVLEVDGPQAWKLRKTALDRLPGQAADPPNTLAVAAEHDELPPRPQRLIRRRPGLSLASAARRLRRGAWQTHPLQKGRTGHELYRRGAAEDRVVFAVFASAREAQKALVALASAGEFVELGLDLAAGRGAHYFDKQFLRDVLEEIEHAREAPAQQAEAGTDAGSAWLADRVQGGSSAHVKEEIRAFFATFVTERRGSERLEPLVREESLQRSDVGRSRRGSAAAAEELDALQQRFSLQLDQRADEKKRFLRGFFARFGALEPSAVVAAVAEVGAEVGASAVAQRATQTRFLAALQELSRPPQPLRVAARGFCHAQPGLCEADVARELAAVGRFLREQLTAEAFTRPAFRECVLTQRATATVPQTAIFARLCHVCTSAEALFVDERTTDELLAELFGTEATAQKRIAAAEAEFERFRLQGLSPQQLASDYVHMLDLVDFVEGLDAESYAPAENSLALQRLVAASHGQLRSVRDAQGRLCLIRRVFPLGFSCEELFRLHGEFSEQLAARHARLTDALALANAGRANAHFFARASPPTCEAAARLPVLQLSWLARLFRQYLEFSHRSPVAGPAAPAAPEADPFRAQRPVERFEADPAVLDSPSGEEDEDEDMEEDEEKEEAALEALDEDELRRLFVEQRREFEAMTAQAKQVLDEIEKERKAEAEAESAEASDATDDEEASDAEKEEEAP